MKAKDLAVLFLIMGTTFFVCQRLALHRKAHQPTTEILPNGLWISGADNGADTGIIAFCDKYDSAKQTASGCTLEPGHNLDELVSVFDQIVKSQQKTDEDLCDRRFSSPSTAVLYKNIRVEAR